MPMDDSGTGRIFANLHSPRVSEASARRSIASNLRSIDRIPPNRFREEFHRTIEFIKGKVLEQPTHDGYLDSMGRSSLA